MSSSRTLTLEHGLYALVLTAAAGMRFLHLGALPLSDFEAQGALQALRSVAGEHPLIGANALYIHLTAVLFYFFEASNFLARFWPALAGASLVLVPYALRGRLGRLPALVLAVGLAVDPGLAALSRLANGPILAVAAILWAAVAWQQKRDALVGVCAGLALLSGPAAWLGLVGLLLAWGLSQAFALRPRPGEEKGESPADGEQARRSAGPDWAALRPALIWGGGTVLLAGTLLSLSPGGLAAPFTALAEYVQGWWTLSDVSLRQVLIALPAYAPLALVFGLVAVVRGIVGREELSRLLGLWVLTAFLLALVYPAHQVADLAWMLIPLWTLAALEFGRHFDFAGRNRWELAGAITLVLALLTSIWFFALNLVGLDLALEFGRVRLLILVGLLLLLAVALLLVAYGWSTDMARLGAVWGGGAMLFFLTIAALTGATGVRQPLTVEMWSPGPRTAQADLLLETVEQVSTWNTSYPNRLPLAIVGVDSPALRWLLRGRSVEELTALPIDRTPAMLVTPVTQLDLVAAYRGQDFVWVESPDWDRASSNAWLRWYLVRQMPVTPQDVILWVRSDLLVDGQDLTTP
ncbi:MAG: hypothetical protein JXB85_08285 [Anaerolineales bacterium]|nr:hypothetical protein [Anaerolineales bacterium]